MAQLLPLDYSILPLIRTLYCRLLSKVVSSTIFKVLGMTRPVIEPRSPGTLANTLPTRTMSRLSITYTVYGLLTQVVTSTTARNFTHEKQEFKKESAPDDI